MYVCMYVCVCVCVCVRARVCLSPSRSDIHGRGLFCKRMIEAGEMVIEYAGNVIRAVLTDKREKYYDSKVNSVTPPPLIFRYNSG